MVEGREDLRFALEPREPVRVGCKRLRQNLQRDVTIELGVSRAVDLAHTTGADLGQDLVLTEHFASHGRVLNFGDGCRPKAKGRRPKL